jgi:hypothetical protein
MRCGVGACGSAVTALEQLRKCLILQCSKNHKTINAKGAMAFAAACLYWCAQAMVWGRGEARPA